MPSAEPARPAEPRPPPPRLTFPRRLRLQHARQFDAIRRARTQRHAGPLALSGLPNDLPYCRLGLSVGARVGGAAARNRLKRLLREAFRLSQRDLPRTETGAYDLVIAARPHQPLRLEDYRRLLVQLAAEVHAEWQRRGRKAADGKADGKAANSKAANGK